MPPAYEILLLNTTIPQIQAAQSGDTYLCPRELAVVVNSATDAVRITQTGTGNALLVEDSANPDSTPFVVTAAGAVGIGTTNPDEKFVVSSTSAAGYVTSCFDNTATNGYSRIQFRIGAAGGSGLAEISYAPGVFFAIGPSSNDTTTPIVFRTSNATERARISSDGTFRVKGAGTAGSTDAFQISGSAPADAARLTSGGNLLVGLTTDPGGTGTISARSTTSAHSFDSTSGSEVIGISKANGNRAYLATVSSTDAGLQVKDSGGTVNLTVGASGKSVALNGAVPQTGTGITFPATQSASSNANTLDDYEEGTWTPAATAATAPTGVTYNFQGGWYRKVGSLVIAGFGINIANVGTGGSGEFKISGFPFASATNGAYREPTASMQGTRWVTSALAGQTYFFMNDSSTVAGTRYQNNADTAINWSDIQGGNGDNGTYCSGVIAYYVA